MRTSDRDIAAYFERIGYRGAGEVTLEALFAIQAAHTRAIPFENLDVVLGRAISLAPSAVHDKLVRRRRGGYCFEHNPLLGGVLEGLGFEVEYLAGRARVGRERAETPPRTHVWLRVQAEGEAWLVDAGLGGLTPTAPLRWAEGEVQRTPHEPRRLVLEEGRWLHQAELDGAWVDVCELSLEPMPAIDREVASWFTSTHPGSTFRARLMVARATEGGRITLADRRLTVRDGGRVERRQLEGAADLREALATCFGLDVSEQIDGLFSRLEPRESDAAE